MDKSKHFAGTHFRDFVRKPWKPRKLVPLRYSGYKFFQSGNINNLECDHVIKGSCDFKGGISSQSVIALPRFDLTRPPHWGVIWTYEWVFLTVCHHLEKFGDHSHCDSGDRFLICDDTTCLKSYVNLLVEAPHIASHVTTLSNLVALSIVMVEICFYFVTWSHKTMSLMIDFIGGSLRWEPLKVSHQPAKFGGHRHFSSGDI